MVNETKPPWWDYQFMAARDNEKIAVPIIPVIPKNIASTSKPEKSDVIENQLSRFGKQK